MPALLAPSRSPVVDDVTRRQAHMFGTAWIPAKPERVDTVGCNGADFAAALGVVPVRARDFIGPSPEEAHIAPTVAQSDGFELGVVSGGSRPG